MGTIDLVLVAAVADNGVIGDGDAMPWRLRADLQRFRSLTMGHPVVMGRRTLAAIGRPLPGRTNIVLSRDPAFCEPGVIVAPSADFALDVARGDALRRGVAEVMIVGGAEIYRLFLPQAARLEITHVHAAPSGTATFPAIDPDRWQWSGGDERPAGPHDSAPVTFRSYRPKEASRPG